MEEGFGVRVPDWPNLHWVDVIGAAEDKGNGVALLQTTAGELEVSLLASGARIRTQRQREYDYGLLIAEPEVLPARITAGENFTQLKTDSYELKIEHTPFCFEFSRRGRAVQQSPTDAHFVKRFRLPPLARLEDGWFWSFELRSGEPVYGLGEKWGKLDKRGQLVRSFNCDALGVNAEISYKNSPFAWSPAGWGLFAHTPAPVTHGVGYAPWSQRAYGMVIEDQLFDLFILASDHGAAMLESYTALTGRSPVPPLWSAGVILSKAYYKTGEEIIAVAKQVRARKMPCDVITFDGRAWQDTDTRFAFEWDPTRYPDPARVVNQLKELEFKICVWEYPLVSTRHPWFDELARKGWLLKDRRSGDAYRYSWDQRAFGPVLTPLPESGIVDFTHPDAYAFWRDAHQPLFELGVDMIKADFGEQVEDDNILSHSGDSGRALHNVYAHLYNRCVYEAAERYCKTGPFLFSRSSWIGCQRFPSQWGGDPQADWGGMAGNIRGGLSWGLTGAPFYATDIGGFYGDQRNDALYVRWVQAGIFSAHMRLHGIGAREPWSYSAEAERAVLNALTLRYRLIPYIRQTMRCASQTGLPVQRAMALAFPEDRAAWAFEDQFMFGDDLLVAPCLNPEGRVEIYLPAGDWYQFPTGRTFVGGRVHRFSLALDELAVFAPQGAKIPLGPAVQHTEMLAEDQVEEYWQAG